MSRFEQLPVKKLRLKSSNSIPVTGRRATQACSIATAPTATNTVTIGSVVYTFTDAAGILLANVANRNTTTAVSVLIGTAAASLTNLVAAINNSGTSGTNYSSNAVAHPLVVAEETDGTVFKVIARKLGNLAIATTETFTDGTDAWTAATTTGGVDGTPGKPGEVRYSGGKFYDCCADQVWRCSDTHTAFNFREPVAIRAQIAALTGVAVGTDNVTNDVLIDGVRFEIHNMGTQTLITPTVLNGTGLLVSHDLTSADGVEYSHGISATGTGTTGNAPACKHAYVAGVSPAFFVRAKIKMTTAAGVTECGLGFRKAEAYNTFDGYDEMATLNSKAGQINIETIINGATNVTTDTTETDWGNGETHEFTVIVDNFGAVSYLYDGVEPTVIATIPYKFDTGDVVVPFLQMVQSATTTAIYLVEWEVGYFKDLK